MEKNRSSLCPKSSDLLPPHIGWQKPNSGKIDSLPSPSLEDFPRKKTKIPPLSRNPITSIAPSSSTKGGITVKTVRGIDYEMKLGRHLDANMDSRRLRRILSNRISAQRSRLRRLHYVNDMERKMKDLKVEITGLARILETQTKENKLLEEENRLLRIKLSDCEATAKTLLAGVEQKKQEVVRMQKELDDGAQRCLIKEEPLTLSCESMETQQYELDPALNFKSLAIDPPNV